jgi:colicin import membrane protein
LRAQLQETRDRATRNETESARLAAAQQAANDAEAARARLAADNQRLQQQLQAAATAQPATPPATALPANNQIELQRSARPRGPARSRECAPGRRPTRRFVRLPADQAQISEMRAQAARLAEENRALQADKETARRQAAELSSQLEQSRLAVTRLNTEASARTEQNAAAATGPGAETDVGQLRAELSRLQSLQKSAQADHNRLDDEVKRSTIELSRVNRELRIARDQLSQAGIGSVSTMSTAPAAVADAGKIAELTRIINELRADNTRLAEANQQLADTSRQASAAVVGGSAATPPTAPAPAAAAGRIAELNRVISELRADNTRLAEANQQLASRPPPANRDDADRLAAKEAQLAAA